mgnify:FL=1
MKVIDKPYQNLRAAMTLARLDTAGLAKAVGMNYYTLTFKLRKKTSWNIEDMRVVQECINKATGENYSLDYLFTE